MRRSDLMAVSPMWLVLGYPSAAVPNPDASHWGENFLQLLTIETVFVHHFVDELLGIRVISEIAAHLHHIVLRLKQEAARRRSGGRISLSRFLACCYRRQATQKRGSNVT